MLVTQKKYNEVLSKLQDAESKIESQEVDLAYKENELVESHETIRDLEKQLEKSTIVESQYGGTVTIAVSKDLETVNPIVKYNPDSFEKMVELHYLDDTQQNNKFAMQLAYMSIAKDALTQIVEAFEAPVED